MSDKQLKIALVGAAGMSFGPVMVYDAIRTAQIRGAKLMMMDINEERLEDCYGAADRLNKAAGNPITIERTTDIKEALDGTGFVLLSVEYERWNNWKTDYEIPRKYGSSQIMGENGGPGGLFHSLRSCKCVLEVCRDIEKYAPDAMLINLTNPMSRVCLAVNRFTKIKNVGLCHELAGGTARIALALLTPPDKIIAEASGINHFTFFYRIENKDTGEDLYPKLKMHAKLFPFFWGSIISHMFNEYGMLATSSDSHVAEYIPDPNKINKLGFPYHAFFSKEWQVRNALTKAYGRGFYSIPVDMLPPSGELAMPIIGAMHTGERTYLGAVNVPNKGYIPNLPDDSIVEVHAHGDGDGLHPMVVPPIPEALADLMRTQIEVQSMVVDAVGKSDPDLAYQALLADPQCPPDHGKARQMFDEMRRVQAQYLPF